MTAVSVIPTAAGSSIHSPRSDSTHAEITVLPMPGFSVSLCIPKPSSVSVRTSVGSGLFVAVSQTGTGNRVMTSGTFTGDASSDPSQWITVGQALPLSSTGNCTDIKDTDYAYGTGLTGGWTKAWEPWVNTTLDADGNRIGGWACSRTLINKGGQTWMLG